MPEPTGLWHGWLVSLIDLNNGIDLTALSEALVINNGKVCVIQWPPGRFINLSGRAGKFGQCEGNQRLLNNRSPHPRMAFTWTRNQRPAKQSSFTYLSIFWSTLSSVTLPSYCDYLIFVWCKMKVVLSYWNGTQQVCRNVDATNVRVHN